MVYLQIGLVGARLKLCVYLCDLTAELAQFLERKQFGARAVAVAG
jgi:hypothetical protein